MSRKVHASVVAVATVFFTVALGTVALADQIVNNIDSTIDSTPETRTITAGDAGTSVGFFVQPSNTIPSGDANGCNATGANPATVNLNVPAGVVATATSVSFTGCGITQTVTFTSTTPSVSGYSIGVASVTGGKSGSLWDTTPATFSLVVNPGDTTPPAIGYTLTPASPDGNDGWYQSDVSLVWSVGDPESSFSKTGCVNQSIASDQAATTYSCSATSAGGTSGPVSVTIKRDAHAPNVSATPDRTPDSNGSYRDPVTITFSGTDVGPAENVSCDAPVTYSGPEGTGLTVSGTCHDEAGNEATATFGLFSYDSTAPTVLATPDRVPDHNGWYNAPFTVTWSSPGADLSDSVTCDSATTYNGPDDGAGSIQGTCTDAAGNTGTGTYNFMYDGTAPTGVSGAPDRPADHDGWYNHEVDMVFAGTDGTSGIASCDTVSYGGPDDTAVTVSGSCVDEAGNVGVGTSSAFRYDETAPTFSAALTPANPAFSGWYNSSTGAPTVSFTCHDDTSDLADPCPGDFTFGEGEDQGYDLTIYDNAGNAAQAGVDNIDVDLTAPVIADDGFDSGTAGLGGWYVSAVANKFRADDSISGLADCPADFTKSSAGSEGSVVKISSGTCSDIAGDTAPAVDSAAYKIDLTDPTIGHTISPGSPDGSNGWYKSAPTITFNCSDNASGVATCFVDGTSSDHITLGESTNAQAVSGTASDNAGRTAADSAGTFYVDLSNPNVSLVGGPANGDTYYFGFVPPAPTCSASDAISGLDGACTVSGYATTVGTHTVTASATDKAGRTALASSTYTVGAWTPMGFYAPVDLNGVWNTVRNGSTVPLKFEVFAGSTELTDTSIVNQPLKATQAPCSGGTTDDIELLSTGDTTLRYDTTAGQFVYNWQTPKKAGYCYVVVVTMADGSSISANFKMK